VTPDDYLVEQLRGLCVDWNGERIVDNSTPRVETTCGLLRQAADALLAGRTEIQRLETERNRISELHAEAQREIDRLRAALNTSAIPPGIAAFLRKALRTVEQWDGPMPHPFAALAAAARAEFVDKPERKS
jgi:hypothetical protein